MKLVIVKKEELITAIEEALQNAIPELKKKLKADIKSRILSRKEVLKVLKCSPETLRNLMYSEQLPYFKVGRYLQYKESDVLALLETGWWGVQ